MHDPDTLNAALDFSAYVIPSAIFGLLVGLLVGKFIYSNKIQEEEWKKGISDLSRENHSHRRRAADVVDNLHTCISALQNTQTSGDDDAGS